MLLLNYVNAHSYVTCTDLRIDGSKFTCKGFPRNYEQGYLNSGRSGFAYIAKDTPVEPKQSKEAYSANHPMAEARSGSDLVLTWPPNNHAAKGSNSNGGSPTVGTIFLYWAGVPDVEPKTMDDWKKNKFATLNYQNCVDGAPQIQSSCNGKITLPAGLKDGVYSFMWWWEQNPGSPYTTAFDIKVTESPADIPGELIDAGKIAGVEAGQIIGTAKGAITSTTRTGSTKPGGFNSLLSTNSNSKTQPDYVYIAVFLYISLF